MHSAPAVVFPVNRSPLAAALLCAAFALGAALLILWLMTARLGWPMLLGLLVWCASSAWTWRAWQISPVGELMWDGQQWRFSAVTETASVPAAEPALGSNVQVLFDLQQHLLLHITIDDVGQWFWLDQASQGERWLALRRAVAWSSSHATLPSDAGEAQALIADQSSPNLAKAAP
jgi:hypothetical protein